MRRSLVQRPKIQEVFETRNKQRYKDEREQKDMGMSDRVYDVSLNQPRREIHSAWKWGWLGRWAGRSWSSLPSF